MERSTNSLTELAERLGEITSDWMPSEPTGQYAIQSISYVSKAARIVAELAKVEIVRNKYSNEICWPTTRDVMDAFDKIIAIAEEGA